MCGRAREHRNRDRFGFYDSVERCAREPATTRFIHSRGDPFSNPPTWSRHYALSASRTVRCTRTFYCIASLYFITPSLFLSLSLSFSLLVDLSWPILNLFASKRLLRAMYFIFVRSFIMLRFHRVRRAPRHMYARICVTHVAASVDF